MVISMSLKKRALEGIVVAGTLMILCAAAEGTPQETAEPVFAEEETKSTVAAIWNGSCIAGLGEYMAQLEQSVSKAQVEQTKAQIVASGEEEVADEEVAAAEVTEEEQEWQTRLMADVDEYLYVRASDDAESEIIGKLYKGDVAEIVEQGEEWTHITSGNVDGYVSNEYCISGTDAMEYANANFETTAQIEADGLRVRSEADTESAVLTAVSEGATLTVATDVETTEDWVAVEYKGNTGYVSAEYVTTGLALGEAVTIEEEQAAAAKKEQEAKEAEAAKQETAVTVQNSAVEASCDEVTLLAALIQCEAGNECYEGQVAVGAVVMNRVRSGAYANSVYGVIYEPYQFSPAASGAVAAVAAGGPKASCVQAAQEALGGVDNTGGKLCFRRASSGTPGVVIGNHVFY